MRVHPLQSTIVYGPVSSNRLGRSLGINVMPTTYKLCSFDCVYCVYGWTDVKIIDLKSRLTDLPRPEQVGEELEGALQSIGEIDYITFSGNGESTLHPQLDNIVNLVVEVRDMLKPNIPLAILSNSSMANRREVRAALQKLDRRIMKLDCGTEEAFKEINRPATEVGYDEIIKGLEDMEGIEIQTMLLENEVRNTSENEIDVWVERLSRIRPTGVQLCSIHHPPADSSIRGLNEERLAEIAKRVERELGIPAHTY